MIISELTRQTVKEGFDPLVQFQKQKEQKIQEQSEKKLSNTNQSPVRSKGDENDILGRPDDLRYSVDKIGKVKTLNSFYGINEPEKLYFNNNDEKPLMNKFQNNFMLDREYVRNNFSVHKLL